jgi:dTDP-4-dehydrorhamnose 3,5-epimerase-like enzyme
VIEGVVRFPLRRFDDERGWFLELRRESALPKATVQTNVSFSRAGTIRGLHYHERGQDDLFACLTGSARVVVLATPARSSARTSATTTPSRSTSRAATRTASRRSPTSSSVTT